MAKRISKDAQALLNLVSNERYRLSNSYTNCSGVSIETLAEVSRIESAMLEKMGLTYETYAENYRQLDADGKWREGLCAN